MYLFFILLLKNGFIICTLSHTAKSAAVNIHAAVTLSTPEKVFHSVDF